MAHEELKSPTWYVVHTRPREEGRAETQLRRRGYQTFYPFERVKRRRKLPHGKERLEVVEIAHFPRYLFVGLWEGQSLYGVNNAEAVSTVLYVGLSPLIVPERVIDSLQAACDESGAILVEDRTKRPAFKGRPGDQVRFGAGPFEGFVGSLTSVKEYDRTGRVTAWLEMLGGAVSVVTDAGQVEVVRRSPAA